MSIDIIFVTTDWLAERLDDPEIAIVDGSWHLPGAGRDGAREFADAHIPGAVFLDIDAVRDTASPYPHMLPSPDMFAEAAGALGLTETMTIVVYDGAGLFSAPRVRWMLKAFGARDVRLLEGGFPKWREEGRPTQSGPASRSPLRFEARFDASGVVDASRVSEALQAASAQVVDARPADRFRGDAPEPRPGVRSGHMPGSLNLPFPQIVEGGRLKEPAAIEAALLAAGVDPARPVITSCGSGVSAAIVGLALESVGRPQAGLYDGSWGEWGARQDLPLATGPTSKG